MGALVLKGENDADQAVTYAKIRARATDVSDGTEDGKLEFFTISNGSIANVASLDNTTLFLNTGLTLTFEGATANAHETTLTVTDPTADRTITLPDSTGTVALTSSDITGNAATATTLETARTIAGQSFDGTGNITIASTDLSDTSSIALLTSSQTLTNKTLTSPQINTQIDFLARAEARFQDASGGQYVALEAPATVSSSVTFTLPAADGTSGQVMQTDGSGALSFTDVATSGFTNSTLTDTPGSSANFDLAKSNNAGSAETPFETYGSDAFGVSVGFVFDAMEPVGSSTANDLDYGSGESHVGA